MFLICWPSPDSRGLLLDSCMFAIDPAVMIAFLATTPAHMYSAHPNQPVPNA